jgi:hypothetical protein
MAIDVSTSALYWASGVSSSIYGAKTDGTPLPTLSLGGGTPTALDAHDGILWIAANPTSIFRAPIGASAPVPIAIDRTLILGSTLSGVAVGPSSTLYVLGSVGYGTTALDGLSPIHAVGMPGGIALAANDAFAWAQVTGTLPAVVAIAGTSPDAMLIANQIVARQGSSSTFFYRKANEVGVSKNATLTPIATVEGKIPFEAKSLAANGDIVVWNDSGQVRLAAPNPDGSYSAPRTVATFTGLAAIAADRACVYFGAQTTNNGPAVRVAPQSGP